MIQYYEWFDDIKSSKIHSDVTASDQKANLKHLNKNTFDESNHRKSCTGIYKNAFFGLHLFLISIHLHMIFFYFLRVQFCLIAI